MKRRINIKSFPSIDVRDLKVHRHKVDPLLGSSGVRLYASGRSALYHVFKSLLLGPNDKVLLPAFHCGVEVEAALRAGLIVDFYNIDLTLNFDLNAFVNMVDESTRAVVVIHYFGFPQELSHLREICREKGVLLIEDCAHALYSKNSDSQWLGTKGDYAVFSMRKTVFLPNGGAILVNNPTVPMPSVGNKHFEPAIIKSSIKSILENEAKRGGGFSVIPGFIVALFQQRGIAVGNAGKPEGTDDDRSYFNDSLQHYENDISAISLYFWGNEDSGKIIDLRRRNYQFLEQKLRSDLKNKFVFPDLPAGVCPLCFPIFSDQRDMLVSKMHEKGVEVFVFGRMLHPMVDINVFPTAQYLADSIIGLPVHQQLSIQDIETVSGALLEILKESKQS